MKRSLAGSSLALVLGLGLACGPAKPAVEVEGWALARAALVDAESCYAKRSETCIREPELIDAAIQAALDSSFKGTMPKLDREVEQVIRRARSNYKKRSQEPAQLETIAALVQAHYDAPSVDTSDTTHVNIDLGALPGELGVRGRNPTIVLTDSPLLEKSWWQGAEAGRVLAKYARAHPDKQVIRVELLIPKDAGATKHLVYRYFREQARVAFGERGEDSVYMSATIPDPLETMAAGSLDLSLDTREFCSKPKTGSSSTWCPWHDPYAERQDE